MMKQFYFYGNYHLTILMFSFSNHIIQAISVKQCKLILSSQLSYNCYILNELEVNKNSINIMNRSLVNRRDPAKPPIAFLHL
jgi:hypothetical protein